MIVTTQPHIFYVYTAECLSLSLSRYMCLVRLPVTPEIIKSVCNWAAFISLLCVLYAYKCVWISDIFVRSLVFQIENQIGKTIQKPKGKKNKNKRESDDICVLLSKIWANFLPVVIGNLLSAAFAMQGVRSKKPQHIIHWSQSQNQKHVSTQLFKTHLFYPIIPFCFDFTIGL